MTDQLRQTRFNKAICGFWKRAEYLFSALRDAWGCGCWQEHTANLLLTYLASDQTASTSEYMYRVVFLTRTSTPWHSASRKYWRIGAMKWSYPLYPQQTRISRSLLKDHPGRSHEKNVLSASRTAIFTPSPRIAPIHGK